MSETVNFTCGHCNFEQLKVLDGEGWDCPVCAERNRIADLIAKDLHIQHPTKPAGVSVSMIPGNPHLAEVIRRITR